MQLQVDEIYDLITTAVAVRLKKDACVEDVHKNYVIDASSLLIELRLLFATLDAQLAQISSPIHLYFKPSKQYPYCFLYCIFCTVYVIVNRIVDY